MKQNSVLQHYYTSCQKGLSGYAGFQSRAETPGLRAQDRRELESKALYQPPRDLPREPDADAIAANFPRAFRFFQLASGHQALARSTYVGQDYSMRWGNYFVHSLVLEGGTAPAWPIDAYAWPGWETRLVPDLDDAMPEPLPLVDAAEITHTADFAFSELQTFLGEGKNRVGLLSSMVRAVFQRSTDHRAIVIRAATELDGVYWIACMQKAFPPACAATLSCSTYQFDPRSHMALNATLGETDFLFDESERRFQFYVFDMVGGQHSDVRESMLEYADTVAHWMATDPERVEGLHRFAACFEFSDIHEDLMHLLRLYRCAGADAPPLSSQEVGAMLSFVSRRGRSDAIERVLPMLASVVRNLGDQNTADDWAAVIGVLTQGAAKTKNPEHLRRAVAAWLAAFDKLVLVGDARGSAILAMREGLELAQPDGAAMLAEQFLAADHVQVVHAAVVRLPAQSLAVVATALVRCGAVAGWDPMRVEKRRRELVAEVLTHPASATMDWQWAFLPCETEQAVEGMAQWAMALLAESAAAGNVTPALADRRTRELGEALAASLAARPETARWTVVNHLKTDPAHVGLLVAEWQAALGRERSPRAAFARYAAAVLREPSALRETGAAEIVERFLAFLSPDEVITQACEWVEDGYCQFLPDAVTQKVLGLAAERVGFGSGTATSDHLARKIAQVAATHRLPVPSVRLTVRAAAVRAREQADGWPQLGSLLETVDLSIYKQVLTEVVLPALRAAHEPDAVHRILIAAAPSARIEHFRQAHEAFVAGCCDGMLRASDRATIAAWLLLKDAGAAARGLQTMRADTVEQLAVRVGALGDSAAANLAEYAEQRQRTRREEAVLWDAFLVRARALRPSLFSKLFGGGRK